MKITLEIEILDEDYAPAFGKLNAGHVQNALARAFPYSRLAAYEVRDVDPRPAEQALRILTALEGGSFSAMSSEGQWLAWAWSPAKSGETVHGETLTDALAQLAMVVGWP